jgi:hypothetical protein
LPLPTVKKMKLSSSKTMNNKCSSSVISYNQTLPKANFMYQKLIPSI